MPTTYAIPDGRTVMAATLYTGTGAGLTISNAVNGISFQPDLVWIKVRTTTYNHNLYDSLRGTSMLASNLTLAENPSGSPGDLTTYNAGGFSIQQTGNYELSHSGDTYVAWQWNAGGSTVTNTDGSISAQVRANPTAGFSVVTYTGNGTNNATVGHGLGVVPSMIILKNRSGAYDWPCYHTSIGSGGYVYLNSTAAKATDANMWKTTPTSTVFTLGTYTENNGSANNYVAYCFAAVAGYSAFGSYTGNGSADGPFVYLGFRPRFVMTKRTDATGGWVMLDSARDSYNVSGNILQAESSAAELAVASYPTLDILSNGFKMRSSTIQNASGGTYIYAAFAENPFKYANAR
jgi:hypothetical protein